MHRSPRALLLAIIVAASIPACVTPGNYQGGTLHRGPYLQQAASNSIVVVWRTRGPTTPVLRFGSTPDALTQEVTGDAITLRVSADVDAPDDVPRLYKEPAGEVESREAEHDPSTAPNTYQYEALVSGLQPGSKYYYAIHDGSRRLAGGDADHYFLTHRPIGSETDMRIWVVGDSGNGSKEQYMVHDAMRAQIVNDDRPIDHYIHAGDMAYGDGTDQEFQDHFFAPYQTTLRNTVCWPTMGNHEGHTSRGISGVGPYYDAYVVPTAAEVGGVASGTEAYYSFDISGVHFICLDSHDLDRSPDAAMARWLRADLDQTKADWLIAFWHHPPYTMGSHNSDRETQLIEMRENFMPILEAAGVDLTLTGHSHIYERSMLMDGAYATPTTAQGVILDDGDGNPDGDGAYRKSAGLQPRQGSVSVVAGHGGANLGREGTMPVMREIILEHGSVLLDIKGDTLNGTMLNKNGEVRDIFSIVKRGTITPTRVENPWQPVHDISLLTEIRADFHNTAVGARPEGWNVVSGDASNMSVGAEEEEKTEQKFLQARATMEPLIGLYTPMDVQEFELTTTIRLVHAGARKAGIVFGYADNQNYGLVVLDGAAGAIRVSRFRNGTETVIAEEKTAIVADQWLRLDIEVADGQVEVQFQRELEFSAPLEAAGFPRSPLGFFVAEDSSAEFRMFVIENERP
ncbi:MAG: metallophosphoesterase [Opitutaceae bacterium]